jgi:hypothetical protein
MPTGLSGPGIEPTDARLTISLPGRRSQLTIPTEPILDQEDVFVGLLVE